MDLSEVLYMIFIYMKTNKKFEKKESVTAAVQSVTAAVLYLHMLVPAAVLNLSYLYQLL